jgi:hypothetical protein
MRLPGHRKQSGAICAAVHSPVHLQFQRASLR